MLQLVVGVGNKGLFGKEAGFFLSQCLSYPPQFGVKVNEGKEEGKVVGRIWT